MELFHGTALSHAELIKQAGLYGAIIRSSPNYSGNLTNDRRRAEISALEAANWEDTPPVILHFQVPDGEVVRLGPIGANKTLEAFATTNTVDLWEVPGSYLSNLGMSREDAAKKMAAGELSFFKVPPGYLKRVEEVPPLLP